MHWYHRLIFAKSADLDHLRQNYPHPEHIVKDPYPHWLDLFHLPELMQEWLAKKLAHHYHRLQLP